MAILVRVPVPILEDLVEAAISKQGNIYRAELAKLIGASKESLDGKTSLYLISLMKLCGFAEADMANVLRKSKIVNQRGAITHDIGIPAAYLRELQTGGAGKGGVAQPGGI